MFKKKQKPESVETPETEGQQFQKNIKVLWIYTTLFCLFALVLILISSFVQAKLDGRAEYYQDQYENVQSSSQSTIKNIQTENAALKADIEKYKADAEFIKKQFETEENLVKNASEMLDNADYLLLVANAISEREYDLAREHMKKIDVNYLTPTMLESYNLYKETLDK